MIHFHDPFYGMYHEDYYVLYLFYFITKFGFSGDMIPHHRHLLLNAVLHGAKDSDSMVRASALSNLGEVCRMLRFSLGHDLHEVS